MKNERINVNLCLSVSERPRAVRATCVPFYKISFEIRNSCVVCKSCAVTRKQDFMII